MSFIHSLERGEEFFNHLNLMLERSVGMICTIKDSEGGFMDDFGSEGEVGGFIGVEVIQLLDSSRG